MVGRQAFVDDPVAHDLEPVPRPVQDVVDLAIGGIGRKRQAVRVLVGDLPVASQQRHDVGVRQGVEVSGQGHR